MRPWEHQPWAQPYRLAILELNKSKMQTRIEAAKAAIWPRIGELRGSHTPDSELLALCDALKILHLLEREAKHRTKHIIGTRRDA